MQYTPQTTHLYIDRHAFLNLKLNLAQKHPISTQKTITKSLLTAKSLNNQKSDTYDPAGFLKQRRSKYKHC